MYLWGDFDEEQRRHTGNGVFHLLPSNVQLGEGVFHQMLDMKKKKVIFNWD